MKNYIIISLLFLSLGFSQNTDDKTNPMKGVKVRNRIITYYEFEQKFGKWNISQQLLKEDSFNINGELIETLTYNSNNKENSNLDHKRLFQYDSNGNQISYEFYYPPDKLSSKHTYKYDSNGNKIEENWYESDGTLKEKLKYQYDSNNNKIKYNNYSKLEKSEEYHITERNYKYDLKGNLIYEDLVFPEYKLREKREISREEFFKYDNQNNTVEYKSIKYYYDVKSKILTGTNEYLVMVTNIYDGNKIVMKKMIRKEDNEIDEKSSEKYEYDVNGNMTVRIRYDENGKIDLKLLKKYNSNGDILQESHYNGELISDMKINKYDSKNRIIEFREYGYFIEFDELIERPKWKYNYEYIEY